MSQQSQMKIDPPINISWPESEMPDALGHVLVQVNVVTHLNLSPKDQSTTGLSREDRVCGEEQQIQSREKQLQEVAVKWMGKGSDLLCCVTVLTKRDKKKRLKTKVTF